MVYRQLFPHGWNGTAVRHDVWSTQGGGLDDRLMDGCARWEQCCRLSGYDMQTISWSKPLQVCGCCTGGLVISACMTLPRHRTTASTHDRFSSIECFLSDRPIPFLGCHMDIPINRDAPLPFAYLPIALAILPRSVEIFGHDQSGRPTSTPWHQQCISSTRTACRDSGSNCRYQRASDEHCLSSWMLVLS